MNKKAYLKIIIFVLILGAIGILVYSNFRSTKVEYSSQQVTSKEAEDLVAEIGKIIVLPEGEQPTIATVNDSGKLKNQPFFSKAKNGYKVLIYTIAKKAILYDPVQRKIVEVSTLNTDNEQ